MVNSSNHYKDLITSPPQSPQLYAVSGYESGQDDEVLSPTGSPVLSALRAIGGLESPEPIRGERVVALAVELPKVEEDEDGDVFVDALDTVADAPDDEKDEIFYDAEDNNIPAAAPVKKQLARDAVIEAAGKVYRFVMGLLLSIKEYILPSVRVAGSETDKKVDAIARKAIPNALKEIILKAIDFIELKRFLARFPECKFAYETVSRFIYNFVLSKSSDTVVYGLDNLVKVLQIPLNKTEEQKEAIISLVEINVLDKTAESLAEMNEAYRNTEGLEALSEEEQTVAVLNYLQQKGQLHESITVLTLEEEKLWATCKQYLKSGESVYEAIVRLEGDQEKNA